MTPSRTTHAWDRALDSASESPATVPTGSEWVVVIACGVLLALAATWPLALHLNELVPQGSTDSGLNAWTLAWAAERLPKGLAGFWTPPVFYPYPSSLAYSENLLGIAVLVAPILWAGGSLTLAYNAAFLLAYVVSAVGGYVLALQTTGSRAAACIGAIAFVMLPYRVAQAGHLQVQWIGWMAIAIWALVRVLRQPSWTMLAVFVGASIFQVLSNAYAAFLLAVAVAVVVSWHLVTEVRPSRRTLVRLALAGVIGAAVLVPVVMAYQHVWAGRAPATEEIRENAADLGTYVSVAEELPAVRWLPGVSQPEGRLFPGVVVSILALIAIVSAARSGAGRTRRTVGLFVAVAALALWISLGPDPSAWGERLPLPSVYAALATWVPLFQVIRVPARFGALVLLAVSMLAAIGAAMVMAGLSKASRRLVVAVLAMVIFFEGYPANRPMRFGVPTLLAEEEQAYQWLAGQEPGAVLELPIGGAGRVNYGLRNLHAVLVHRNPIVNGLNRLETPLQELLGGSASPLAYPDRQADVLPMLQALEIRYLVVRPSRFRDPEFGANTWETLRSSPLVAETRTFGDVHVLRLQTSEPSTETPGSWRALPASAFTLTASVNSERVALAVDGDARTRWLTGRPQDGQEWIAATFDRVRDVASVDIVLSDRSLRDYPRHLRIESVGDAEQPRVLYDADVLVPIGRAILESPRLPVMSIRLPPNRTRTLTLRQTGQARVWYWSMDELILWERPF